MNWRRTLAVMVKEIRQLRRDRITFAMVLGIPIIQLLLFGYAINTNLRGLDAAIADMANTSGSRAVVMDMLATGLVKSTHPAQTPQEVEALMRGCKISVGIIVPPDLERRRLDGRESVQVSVDGSDNAVQFAAMQLAQVPIATAPLKTGPPAQRPVSVLALYNPRRRSAVNIVPGLIGVILTMTMVLFTAVAIVRERERGNMELLIATPLKRSELMVGKIAPYIVIGLIQTTLILALGVWLFNVPIAGSLLDVFFAAGLLIFANLALGLLISTAAQSQFQAMQMTFFVFLPSILLSGFMFPFAGMPKIAQWIAEVLPLIHFLRLIRGIMLRGAGLLEMWPEVAALTVFSIIMMTAAILRFPKSLD